MVNFCFPLVTSWYVFMLDLRDLRTVASCGQRRMRDVDQRQSLVTRGNAEYHRLIERTVNLKLGVPKRDRYSLGWSTPNEKRDPRCAWSHSTW